MPHRQFASHTGRACHQRCFLPGEHRPRRLAAQRRPSQLVHLSPKHNCGIARDFTLEKFRVLPRAAGQVPHVRPRRLRCTRLAWLALSAWLRLLRPWIPLHLLLVGPSHPTAWPVQAIRCNGSDKARAGTRNQMSAAGSLTRVHLQVCTKKPMRRASPSRRGPSPHAPPSLEQNFS